MLPPKITNRNPSQSWHPGPAVGYPPLSQSSETRVDLEYANMRHDLPKRRPVQDSVLATGPRPERRGTRPAKIIGPQTATTSTLPTDSSGYVIGPLRGVSAGHCPLPVPGGQRNWGGLRLFLGFLDQMECVPHSPCLAP